MGSYYNGYDWNQREAILKELARLKKAGSLVSLSYLLEKKPCAVCADPDCPTGWHSEDYSPPYVFSPPATYVICAVCHGRLHKRFGQPSEWLLFVEHLKAGGYGGEFVRLHTLSQRKAWIQTIAQGGTVFLPRVRNRLFERVEWWQQLTLNPESLFASWARPRPWRPHPTTSEYRGALDRINPSEKDFLLLRAHAQSPQRTATMRQLAVKAFAVSKPSVANAQYGALSHRFASELGWQPDLRADGSPIWMSAVAEGWKPEHREFEWTMVPSLQAVLA